MDWRLLCVKNRTRSSSVYFPSTNFLSLIFWMQGRQWQPGHTDPTLVVMVQGCGHCNSLWIFEYKPIEFGLVGHINSIFIVGNTPRPFVIVLVGADNVFVSHSHALTGFYILAPPKGVVEPTPATIKQQHSWCCCRWGSKRWSFGKFYHVLEILVPAVAPVKFNYGIVHVCSRSKRRAVCPQPCVLYYHTPSVAVRLTPVKYTCRSADGTRQSSWAWWAETVGCMW